MKKTRFLLVVLLTIVLSFTGASTVFAGTVTGYSSSVASYDLIKADSYDIEDFINKTKKYSDVVKIENEMGQITSSAGGFVPTKITFDKTAFIGKSEKEQKECLTSLTSTSAYSKMSDESREQFTNDISVVVGNGSALIELLFSDTKPNYGKALSIMKPFSSPLQVVLGIGVIFLSGAIIVVIVLDIAYLTMPFEERENSHKWASREAKQVLKEAADKDTYGTPVLWSYFKARGLMLFLFGLCLLYLVDGAIFKIIGWLLDLASGLGQ